MQQALRTKLSIAILAALVLIAALVAVEFHASRQTAVATTKLAAGRDQAEHIDHHDWAAVQRIREAKKQKTSASPEP